MDNDQVGTGDDPIDPRLRDLANNGGSFEVGITDVPHLTHALNTGSPAVDAADPNPPGNGGTCEIIDQRGEDRPDDGDGGAVCDPGSFEGVVSSDDDDGGGGGGGCSLATTGPAPLDPLLWLLCGGALLAVASRRRISSRAG